MPQPQHLLLFVKASSYNFQHSIKHSPVGPTPHETGFLLTSCITAQVLPSQSPCLPYPLPNFLLLDHCRSQVVLQSLIQELSGTRLRTNHT